MLTMPKSCFDEIAAHAEQEYPKECCGISIGVDDEVHEVLRGYNVLQSEFEYLIDPKDTLRALKLTREREWDIVGFYHSHTATDPTKVTEAYPSKKDVAGAAQWPTAYYLIVSLKDRARPDLRAFRILDGEIHEQELQIV